MKVNKSTELISSCSFQCSQGLGSLGASVFSLLQLMQLFIALFEQKRSEMVITGISTHLTNVCILMIFHRHCTDIKNEMMPDGERIMVSQVLSN